MAVLESMGISLIACHYMIHRPAVKGKFRAWRESSALPLRPGPLPDELLDPFAHDVAGVEVSLRVGGHRVEPVALARLFLAVLPDRHGPDLADAAVGRKPHEDLVLGGRVAAVLVPRLRRGAADPDFILRRDPQAPRHDDAAPLVEILPLLVEQLDPPAVAVGHVEDAAGINDDLVRQAELARPAAVLAPCLDELAPRIEVDHAAIAVSVGDEDVALGSDRHIRGRVEMRAVLARRARRAEHEQQLTLGRELFHHVGDVIGDPDVSLAVEPHAVNPSELALPPTVEQFAFGGIDLHRNRRALEAPDAILPIDGHAGHGGRRTELRRTLGPRRIDGVFRHRRLRRVVGIAGPGGGGQCGHGNRNAKCSNPAVP